MHNTCSRYRLWPGPTLVAIAVPLSLPSESSGLFQLPPHQDDVFFIYALFTSIESLSEQNEQLRIIDFARTAYLDSWQTTYRAPLPNRLVITKQRNRPPGAPGLYKDLLTPNPRATPFSYCRNQKPDDLSGRTQHTRERWCVLSKEEKKKSGWWGVSHCPPSNTRCS